VGAGGEEVADLRALLQLRSGKPSDAAAALKPLLSSAQRPETAALFLNANTALGHPLSPRDVGHSVPQRLRSAPEVVVAEARGHVEMGRTATAESLASYVLKRAERSRVTTVVRAEALAVLGRALYDEGSVRTASHDLEEAWKLDPHNARAAYQLAVLAEERANHADARKMMEAAVKADPAFADALYEVGRMRARDGDEEGARAAYQGYLKLDANGPYADDARRALGEEPVEPPPKPKHSSSHHRRH
jgi:tetratricopeptide (TPR) repeat protein